MRTDLAAIIARNLESSLAMGCSVVLATLGKNLQETGLHAWRAKQVK